MTDPVAARGLTGKAYELQPDQVAGAVEAGAKPISDREASESHQAWTHMRDADERWSAPEKALGGVFSGLTLGLGPAGLAAAGLANPHDIEALEGSGAYQAGNIAGMVAPAFLTDGASLGAEGGLLGKALGWTPAGLMGRAGAGAEALVGRLLPEVGAMGKVGQSTLRMAARGATEGTLVNLAHTVSDSYIQDKPLTAQSLAASGVNGALFGGLAGGILGGAGAAAGAGIDSVGGSVLGSVAGKGDSAAASALKRLGASESDLARLASEEGGLVGAVRKYHDILEKGGESFASNTSTIGKVLKQSKDGYTAGASDIVDLLDREAGSHAPDLARVTERLSSDLEAKYGGTLQQNDVTRVMRGLQEDLGSLKAEPAAPFAGEVPSSFSAKGDHYELAAQMEQYTAAKALHEGREAMLPKAGGTWKQWVDSRNQLAEMVEKARGGVHEEVYRTALNAMDSEIGAAMDAAGASIANPSVGEQFRAAVMGQRMSEEMGGMVKSKLGKELAGNDGSLRPTDMGTMAWGTLMGHPFGAAGIVAAKGVYRTIERKLEPAMAEAAYRSAVGAQAAKATVDVGNRVNATLKKFMGMGGKVAPMELSGDRPKYDLKSFKKTMDLSDKLTSDVHRQKVNDLVAAMNQMGHPDLANEMAAQYQRATDYLNFNKPKDAKLRSAGSLGKMPARLGLDTKEMRYMRIFSAVSKPMSIVDGILDGTVSREAVNAIAYVMPDWHADIVSRAANMTLQAKEEGKFLPADKIATLGVVLNAPVDSKLEKSFIDEVQRGLQANNQPQPAPGKPQPQGQMMLAQSSDYKTPMQTSLG